MNFSILMKSLNRRITILTLTVFLIAIWSMAFYASYIEREETQRLLSDQQFSTVTMLASDIDREIKERMSLLVKVAEIIDPSASGNSASMQSFLNKRKDLESHFSGGILVTRLDGTAIADAPHLKGRTGISYIDMDYIAAALKNGKTTIGMPVIDKYLNNPIIGMAAPIHDVNGTVIGALAGIIDLSKPNFLDKITGNSYGKTGGFLIVAKQQRQVVTATDKSRIMEILPAPGVNQLVDRAIQGVEDTAIATTPQGLQVLASSRGVPTAGWCVVALIPTSEVFGPIKSMQQRLLLTAFLLTLLASGLTKWLLKMQRAKESLADQVTVRVEELERTNQFEEYRSHILELLVKDGTLSNILEAIVRGIEQLHPEMLCSILLLDQEGKHLGRCVGPSLPDSYNAAINGMEIGMGAGSCGTAAFTGERVIVDDIATHPYWAPYKELAARAGLGSCWSQPIRSSSGQVLGTFAIYHHEACSPTESEISLIEQSANLASVAIDKNIATETLHTSEQRLRSFIENANDVLFALTPEGLLSYVSPQWKTAFGYEISETVGQPFPLFVHLDDVTGCLTFLQKVIETGEKQEGVEYRVRCKDGRYLWYRANASLVKDPVDGTQMLVGIGRNVNEEKQARETLKKAEELYHSLVETSQDLIWRCDGEGRYTYINLAWEQVLGYQMDEMLGKRCCDFMTHENAECFEAYLNHMMEGGNALHGCDATYRGKNGENIHLVFNALPLYDEYGEYLGASGTAFDITERKLSEEKLQQFNESLDFLVYKRTEELINERQRLAGIIQGTNVGTWEWNVQTGEIVFNDRWAEIIGYKPEEISPVSIETWMKFGHPDDLKESRELLKKHFRGELDYYAFESRMRHKDGNWVWVLDRGKVATWTEDGKPLMMMGTHQDINESKKLKDQLMQSQKMEAVGQLAGGLAHDFNNVLSIINGYCTLLQMDMVMNEEQKESFERILAASKRAGDLTHSMLAFSRTQVMNSQNQELNFVVLKVGGFVEKIIGDNISFKTIINDENLPVYVDSGQIEQALINLANNARDAMPNGGKLEINTNSVTMDASFIAAHGYGTPGRYAVISVSDTGTGIGEEAKKKIFEPFFTTKAADKGTGLGLAMVYGIIKQHNGYVDVFSEPGHGSCFIIYLPIVGKEAAGSSKKSDDDFEASAGSETILIAEDNADVMEFTNKMLTRLGYQVICAVDGQDAVDKFKENADKIQLIIMDMIMPNKSGKAAYDEIRQIKPETKALFSSGYSASIIQQQGELGKNAEFMSKPVQPAELLKKVRGMLDGL